APGARRDPGPGAAGRALADAGRRADAGPHPRPAHRRDPDRAGLLRRGDRPAPQGQGRLAGCGKTQDRSIRHANLKGSRGWGRRGDESTPDDMFSYVRPEQRVPANHPWRPIRTRVDEVLRALSPRFARLYAKTGRPSIPPEQLLRALLLQTLDSIRSERQIMEQLNFNILYRWFVGLSLDAPVWDVTVFTKNRERLLAG